MRAIGSRSPLVRAHAGEAIARRHADQQRERGRSTVTIRLFMK